jgi:hypothetical protein
MIVLSENPLDDISNTKKIEGVIVDGQFIDSKQISETEIEKLTVGRISKYCFPELFCYIPSATGHGEWAP